jgi:hypothetical protein
MVAGERIERSPNAYEAFHRPLIVTRNRIGSGQLNRTTVARSSGVSSPIELGRNGAPCQNRTDLSDLQDRRIASNAYRANKLGANAGNRNQVCCIPGNCSATELHRLGAPLRSRTEFSGIRNLYIAVNACSAGASTENRTPLTGQAIRCSTNEPCPLGKNGAGGR